MLSYLFGPLGNQGAKAREHFAGIHIQKNEDGYAVTYVDPVGSGDVSDIPQHVTEALFEILDVLPDQITSTTNRIQHRTSSIFAEGEVEYLTNVHCGPFTGFLLSGLALENIRVEGNRLQIITTEGWQDIPDLDEEQSNSFGIEIRRQNLNLLTGIEAGFPAVEIEENDLGMEELTGSFDNVAREVAQGDAHEHYKLKRSDSNMSQYSDLVEEMLKDQIDAKFEAKQQEYDVLDVVIRNPAIVQIDANVKALESANKSLGQRAKNGGISVDEKAQKQQANRNQKAQLKARKDALPKEQEREYEGDLAEKKMHLFRGKNLNNVVLDPSSGHKRIRTKKEKEDYATKKYAGKDLYADGTEAVSHDQDRLEYAEKVTRGYIRGIKEDTQKKSLFGAGTSYTSAVGHLMRITHLNGNAVAAATKFPWVAAEYMVGQMGGAAGGNRNTAFGYQKHGKPVNRLLGNGFVMSLSLVDYKSLRDSNDLIDVNLDIPGRGMECNRMIEEITFVSKIEGKFVKGSLPMTLPRLDRNWGDMSREKHAQYRRVFGLEKHHYEHFQSLLKKEGDYPLGSLTEYLIQHHGNLLREIAINSDRKSGYQGKFVATQNSSEIGAYHGDLTDLNNYGKKLALRDARTGSSTKSSPYFERQQPEDHEADHLQDRISSSAATPIAPSKNEVQLRKHEEEVTTSQAARTLFKESDVGLESMSKLTNSLPNSAKPRSRTTTRFSIKLSNKSTSQQGGK